MRQTTRQNRMLRLYSLIETGPNQTRIESGDKSITVNASIVQLESAWFLWIARAVMIQDAFPFLNADEREFLMTGFTTEEWDEMFKERK